MIIELETPQQFERSFDIYKVLRPHLNRDDFVDKIQRQYSQGFRIIAIEEDNKTVALAGYRFLECTAWGKILYIDDLITDPESKRRGHASQLLDRLVQLAKDNQCDEVHLDTGHTRFDAHRLYLNKGFRLICHHMSLPL